MQPAWSSTADNSYMQKLPGSVWYRERMMLPKGSEIIVSLEDVSKMDVAAELIARTRIPVEGGPPYAFELNYDPAKLDQRGRYALRARIENEGRLLFINTEHVAAFDRQPGEPVEIMVTHVPASRAAHAQESKRPDASLLNTYWKPVSLYGERVALGAGEQELNMVLTEQGNVRGFAGCNRYTGGYTRDAASLVFSNLASTMMACMEGMEQEQRFHAALGSTVRYEIHGEQLTFYDNDDQAVLIFEAVYLQ